MIDLLLLTIITCSLFILISNHPIYCLFNLILVFVNFSIILLCFNLQFLALSYIIVYVGAICVLFIFVILLLNIRIYSLSNREKFWWVSTIAAMVMVLVLTYLTLDAELVDILRFPNTVIVHKGDILLFGKSFFNYNWQYLLLTVLLLLLSVIATIAVSLKKKKNKTVSFRFFLPNK